MCVTPFFYKLNVRILHECRKVIIRTISCIFLLFPAPRTPSKVSTTLLGHVRRLRYAHIRYKFQAVIIRIYTMPSVIIDMSSSVSVFADKRDPIGGHFRWDSIKKFVFLACTYSNSVYNFDIFSQVCHTVSLYQFLLFQIIMGMTYIFMDFFIKLYTRRIDGPKLLNPLMRGVTCGLFLQTSVWALFHSQYVGDTARFLFSSFRSQPGWTTCPANILHLNVTCIPASEILYKCHKESQISALHFRDTSSHHNYEQCFVTHDRSILTTRFFAIAIVWAANFFLSTVSDDTLIKILKLAFMCRTISTLVILIFLYLSARQSSSVKAFHDIFSLGSNRSSLKAATHVAYMYGIGFLGLHDFSSMSVFTMIDNALVLYTLVFISTSLIRSWVVRVLYLELTSCVNVDKPILTHYLMYALLPLSTEFFHAHKLYIFYLYVNVVLSTTAYLIMLTLTMAKVLHSEFTSVKNIYLVGMLCCIGFGLSLFIVSAHPQDPKIVGIMTGVDVVIFYLGGLKAAIIMWIYGVQRFSTDIHFWLGFKPTKYWTICWMCLPITIFICLSRKIYLLTQLENNGQLLSVIVWIVLTITTVAFFQIKTIAKFILQNNLVNVISANKRYGPPDADDRKRRRNFDETVQLRLCKHNCHNFYEMIDCNHLPLIRTSSGNMLYDEESDSLADIYEARPTRSRPSAAVDVT